MSKKTMYIIGAIVVIGILIWGYKYKGWFGGVVPVVGGGTGAGTGATSRSTCLQANGSVGCWGNKVSPSGIVYSGCYPCANAGQA